MMERRISKKKKINIGAIMKTWLREKPRMSKGFYMWVTSEFHPWVTSVSGMREVWFPQWEGSSRVAGGDSLAAESPLLTLGVLRDPQQHLSLTPTVAPQGEQWGWEVPFSEAEIPDIPHLIKGTKEQRRKACPWEDRNRSIFFMFLLLQD